MQTKQFYSHGKLLLTGEYVVLDGAKALALPTKLGQYLEIKPVDAKQFQWLSYLKNDLVWQNLKFELKDILQPPISNNFKGRLLKILNIIYQSKPTLFDQNYLFKTKLEFDKDWGLGSSSTLINNLAEWAKIDSYKLLEDTFGGSGYDIAAAKMQKPLFYQKQKHQIFTSITDISSNLKPNIYFIYLNQKQNSRDAIKAYRQNSCTQQKACIDEVTDISEKITKTNDLISFEKLLIQHEDIISKVINQKKIQDSKFKDYKSGIVKSLGAWGGDFVLVTAQDRKDLEYFDEKGYKTIFRYEDLVY